MISYELMFMGIFQSVGVNNSLRQTETVKRSVLRQHIDRVRHHAQRFTIVLVVPYQPVS